jgi:hypothetical protein
MVTAWYVPFAPHIIQALPLQNPPIHDIALPQSATTKSRASAFNSRYRLTITEFSTIENEAGCIVIMSGQGLEALLEGLIPEIAYSGQKGESHALDILLDSDSTSLVTEQSCLS